ncbi:MAG TPA: FG-GAP repeat protein [Candidatus Binatia bacterium]|nr:FG-GAP repeat protein [Candidatus Binatia bacterium]
MRKFVIVAGSVLALSLAGPAHGNAGPDEDVVDGESVRSPAGGGLGHFTNRLPLLRRSPTQSPPEELSGLSGGSSNGVAKGDFNGDGFADLAIGVPGEVTGGAAAGAVNVIYGSADGLVAPATAGPTTPEAQFISQNAAGVPGASEEGDRFGAALAAGDFNGDGKSDLAIGIPGEDVVVDGFNQSDVGRIVVIYGSDQGLVTSGAATVLEPQSFDLLTGRDSSLLAEHLGSSLAWGDFNGDSIADLAIGIPDFTPPSLILFAHPSAGAVWVLFGQKDNGLVLTGNQLFTQEDTGQGSSDTHDLFGFALAGGDFDGDKVSDLAIGVPDETIANAANAGRVVVLYGVSGTGLTKNRAQFWSQDSDGIVSVPLQNENFGFSLAAGDFNGDKRDDLAIGVPGQSIREINSEAAGTPNVTPEGTSAGAVHILPGSSSNLPGARSGLTATGSQFWNQDLIFGSGSEQGDQFGRALAAGDFNADGKLDLAIGVPLEDTGGRTNVGEVDVIYGSSAGLSPTTVRAPQRLTDTRPQGGAQFGRSLTAWNFGRDETHILPPDNFSVTITSADLAVGAPFRNSSGKRDAGEVKVFYGSVDNHGLQTSGTQIWTQASSNVPGSPEPDDNFGGALY